MASEEDSWIQVELGGARYGRGALDDPTLAAYRDDPARLAELEQVVHGVTEPEPPAADGRPPRTVLERLLDAAGV